ncbi:hypothetical protein D1831_05485 [Lactiplantibacillus garii]|uniref:ABC transporter ATP-binding protein n=1 Tax=Lactiplantibacillus garii TaxID=2306423 RepID=A0A426D8F8_9LACO|nr:hypothetical protein [Lactiplantibacillus garii]RRK10880.1 hypothetical protein D1831_05485 [Lactiplantibacillus garii]
MAMPVFEIQPDKLARAYGDVALRVYRHDVVAVAGVSAPQFVDFDRRILSHVAYSYEVITDYCSRDDRVALIDATVSIGKALSPGWEQRVTKSTAAARKLTRLLAALDVVVDHRPAMTWLTEKKIQLAVAAVNTTDCLLLDDPPVKLTYWERQDYWRAVSQVTRYCSLGWLLRTRDLDLLSGWLTRLIVIKNERVVIDAPMTTIKRDVQHATLLRIDRRALTTDGQERLLASFPQSEVTAHHLRIQVPSALQVKRRLKRANLTAKDVTVEAGRLSHFVRQSLAKNGLQLYWLNQRLNL